MPVAKPYKMPPIQVGRGVVYCRAPGGKLSAAIVTEVSDRSVSLSLLPTGSRGMVPLDSASHASDPDLFKRVALGEGFWDYTDFDKQLMGIVDQLDAPTA
jgi:hypothetical protein